jgi:hypothetical protein
MMSEGRQQGVRLRKGSLGMPLETTGEKPEPRPTVPGLGFRMRVVGSSSSERVYVVITAECLRAIDGSGVPDPFGDIGVFDRNRREIEEAASVKYDEEGVIEQLDGQPVLILQTDDMPTL